MKSFFILCFLLLSGNYMAFSQSPSSWYYENELDLAIPVKENWSMEIGLGNRGLLSQSLSGETSGYEHQHVEINQFTHYSSTENLIFSLGLRYRFKEIFDQSETNEFRIIEQIEIESPNSSFPITHRLRLEQRFKENTVHRLRYDIGIDRHINKIFSWGLSTEALYSISSGLKPEAEQRFSIGFENSSFDNLEVELNFEYRLEDFTRNPGHEFFIITGVSLDL